jgi:hypothetical protein
MTNAELKKKVKSLEHEIEQYRDMLKARDETHRLDASCLELVRRHSAYLAWAASLHKFVLDGVERSTDMLKAAAEGRIKERE